MSKHRIFPVALSILALSAGPAFAQDGPPAPDQPQAGAAAAAPDQAQPGPQGAGTMSAHLFVGPAFGLGNRSLVQTRTTSTTQTATTPGTDAVTTTVASSSITSATQGDGIGVMYGADYTWWASPRFGLGVNLFGTWLGSGQSATILHLNGQQPSSYVNATGTTGNTTTTTTITDTTAVSPSLPGAPTYTVTIGVPAAGATAPLSTTYTAAPGGTALTLHDGVSSTTNPKDTFASTGGMEFTNSTALWLNDFGVNGTYALWSGPRGRVSLFGGATIPVIDSRSVIGAKTTDGKNGDVATETDTNFDATGSVDFTKTTTTTINNTTTADSLLVAMGPVFGVNLAYDVTPDLHLFTQIGYAPVLDGSMTTNAVAVASSSVKVVTSGVTSTAPAGTTNGSTTTNSSATAPTQVVVNLSGAETMASIGAAYRLGALNVSVEGVARAYIFGATPQEIYGLRAGAGLAF